MASTPKEVLNTRNNKKIYIDEKYEGIAEKVKKLYGNGLRSKKNEQKLEKIIARIVPERIHKEKIGRRNK